MIKNTPKVRKFTPQEWETYRDLRLRALADSPDAFGSTLAAEQDRSDAEWSNRLVSGADSNWDLPLLAEIDIRPIGLAWGRIEKTNPDVANLYQMWVAPTHRCLGAGKMLLEAVVDWARTRDVNCLDLGVTFRNSPAMRLYTHAGFQPVGEPQPMRQGSELLGQPMRLKLRSNAA
jgi:GNAT superfamily N-acetyltransferase